MKMNSGETMKLPGKTRWDPRSQGIELEEEYEVDAMEFIQDVSQSLNNDVGVDYLANYRAKQGLWSRPFIWKNVAEMDPVVWWRGALQVQIIEYLPRLGLQYVF
ncbi:hypothetical protein HF086_015485 [Spodoptera exigua]|uniref:Uncharacterized protein n=1 Tax=Spodoptera exigua TaxID=7107 RepID=A0A922MEA3_SPOEX|nr:hypothetical protein HF086_015485 [Spodoptera exigua]